MIAFASLFLGLFLGVKPVEMVVGEGVAAVELRLDGRSMGTLRGAPWRRELDFGSELAPRHLEAVATPASKATSFSTICERWPAQPGPEFPAGQDRGAFD